MHEVMHMLTVIPGKMRVASTQFDSGVFAVNDVTGDIIFIVEEFGKLWDP
jgi:hypothetical protein